MTPTLIAAANASGVNVGNALNNTLSIILILGGFLTIVGVLVGVYRAVRNSGIKDRQLDDLLASQPTPQERAAQAVRNAKLDEFMLKVGGDGTPANPGIEVRFQGLDTRMLKIENAMAPNGLNTMKLGDMARRTELAVNQLSKKFDEHKEMSDQTHLAMWTAIMGDTPRKGVKE